MNMSFQRSTTKTKLSSSTRTASSVRSQPPSAKAARVAAGLFQ
jgi:hypothetical protein